MSTPVRMEGQVTQDAGSITQNLIHRGLQNFPGTLLK